MPERKAFKSYAKPVAELVAGVVIVVIIVTLLHYTLAAYKGTSLPEGWALIRPPDEVSTLVIVNDTVWTGGKNGLVLISRTNKTRVPVPGDPPPFGFVRAIIMDSQGRIWVGHDGGLARYDSGVWHILSGGGQDSYPFNEALSLHETKSGRIWAGSREGIAWFGDGSWHRESPDGGLRLATTDVLYEDSHQALWIGSADPNRGGLYRFMNGSWAYYSVDNGLPHQAVRMILESRDGAILIATGFSDQGGLLRIQGDKHSVLLKTDGLAADNSRSVYEDSKGRLWVGSEYDGIAIRDNGNWSIITTANGLAGNELKVMKEDETGGYWLGTSGGLNWVRSGEYLVSCGCSSS